MAILDESLCRSWETPHLTFVEFENKPTCETYVRILFHAKGRIPIEYIINVPAEEPVVFYCTMTCGSKRSFIKEEALHIFQQLAAAITEHPTQRLAFVTGSHTLKQKIIYYREWARRWGKRVENSTPFVLPLLIHALGKFHPAVANFLSNGMMIIGIMLACIAFISFLVEGMHLSRNTLKRIQRFCFMTAWMGILRLLV